MINKLKALIVFLLLCGNVYADIEPVDTLDISTAPVVNENFRTLNSNVNAARLSAETLNAYFTGGILQTAYGGTGVNSSNWTSGDVVYMSSTGVWGHTSLSHGLQLFTSSGTFTAPSGVTKVYITAIGAGAGGGGCNGAGLAGGGGGSGSYVINYPYTVTPSSSYPVTINSGGAGNSNASGSNGGTTVFDTLTLLGGSGGVSDNLNCNGGAAGVGLTQFTATGISSATSTAFYSGFNGAKCDIGGQYGGTGAPSIWGGSTGTSGRNTTGNSGTANTGVGGGGCWSNAANQSGGNGATGFVLVQY